VEAQALPKIGTLTPSSLQMDCSLSRITLRTREQCLALALLEERLQP
jgi:hypothetical protein